MSDDENSYTSDNEENNPITLKTNNTPMKIVSKGKYKDNDEIDDSEVDDNESSDEDDDEEVEVEVEDPLLKITGGAEEIDDDDAINDDDDEDSDIELDEDGEPIVKKNISETKTSKTTKLALKKPQLIVDDEEDDEFDDNYLQKFDNDLIKNYVNDFHPECLNHNYDEISKLTIVTRNQDGIIVDPLHRTIPYLTKYEKARVLGQRAKQIETGAKPLVKVPENIVDSYIIAELELREKKVPFIIRRPIPGGGCEYWNIKDLEQIAF